MNVKVQLLEEVNRQLTDQLTKMSSNYEELLAKNQE
jgi:hypothetical protein